MQAQGGKMNRGIQFLLLGMAVSSAAHGLSLDLNGLSHRQFSLDESPLFLGAQADANVLLLMDDSISMSSSFALDHDADNDGSIDKLGSGGSRDGGADQAQGMARGTDDERLIYPWLHPAPPFFNEVDGTCRGDAQVSAANIAGSKLPDEEQQPFCSQLPPSQELMEALRDNDWVRTDAGVTSAPRFSGDLAEVWKLRSVSFNPLYYDPNKTYSPWPGVDSNGISYSNASFSAARLDAYDVSKGTVNLGQLQSYTSIVPLQDGTYKAVQHQEFVEDGGCLVPLLGGCLIPAPDIEIDTRYDLSLYYQADGTEVDIAAAQQQNFANWFQYYRSRELVAKGIAGSLVEAADGVRVAYATIHQNDSVAEAAVALSADDSLSSGVKRTLLDAIYSTSAAATATPLRRALEDAGNYFRCQGDARYADYYSATTTEAQNVVGDSSCPVLTEPEGGDCQLHNTVLITDGYSTAHAVAVTHTGYPAETGNAGDAVNNYNSLTPASNYDGDDNSDFDGAPYGDTVSGTLADAAMSAYEGDLSATLDGDQRMYTHAIVLAAENAGSGDVDDILEGNSSWPTPLYGGSNEPLSSDPFEYAALLTELRHATENGRGEYISGLGQSAASKLIAALNTIGGSNLSGTNTSASSAQLNDDTLIFTTSYNFANWNGDLVAYSIADDGSLVQEWSAASQLTSDSGRTILTYDSRRRQSVATGYDSGGIPFTVASLSDMLFLGPLPLVGGLSSDLEDTLGALLGLDLLGALGGVVGGVLDLLLLPVKLLLDPILSLLNSLGLEALLETLGIRSGLSADDVNYVRGDRSNELQNGGTLRDRFGTVLGPILSSNPVYVGAPNFDYADTFENPNDLQGQSYRQFAEDNADRAGMVYVGANDGMLHGFDAVTGEERIAYVPSRVMSNLESYSETDFTPQAYVDGQISVVDVYGKYPGCDGGSCWRTILVGSLGRGGQAIYALDVTEPGTYDVNGNFQSGSFSEANADELVLWEFTDAGSLNDVVNDLLQDAVCDALLGLCDDILLGLVGTLVEDLVGAGIVEPLLDLLIVVDEQRGHAGLGYTISQPNIVHTAADFGFGSDANTTGDWAVIVANGYNNTEVDLGLQEVGTSLSLDGLSPLSVSLTGNGYFYAVDLETGILVKTFDTKIGALLDLGQILLTPGLTISLPDLVDDASSLLNTINLPTAVPNGVATSAVVDVDQDNNVDYVYGGDLAGNLWKLDLSSSDENNWGFHASSGGDPVALFQTTNFSGVPQPITTEPMVMRHPDYPGRDGQIVLVGTGEMLEADSASEVYYKQSIYGLWDKNDGNPIATNDPSKFLRRYITDSVTVNIDTDLDGTQESATVRLVSDDNHDGDGDDAADGPINWSTHLGWYIDLVEGESPTAVNGAVLDGERVVADPVLRNGRLLLSTTIVGEDICVPAISNWLFELDAKDGSPTVFPPFDLNGDGGVTFADLYTDEDGVVHTPAGRFSDGTYNPVPTILINSAGQEVHITSGADGGLERTVINPIGFERSRATWRQLR